MSKVNYISAEGLRKIEAEYHDLKTVKRRELANRIEAAKALGDLSENAEYHEAKDALGFVEGRILEIEDFMKNYEIIKETGSSGVVRIGCTVVVESKGKQKTFHIVGSNEADPPAGRISNESPIGGALLGTKVGDKVSVDSPGGTTTYTIVEIR